jgi:quercetin dioxygenase-like cupin family protein
MASVLPESDKDPRLYQDPYLDWCEREALPIYDVFGVDLLTLETKPWPRVDANGAFVHLKGRGDFISVFLIDIPPGASISPQQHLYEEVIFVMAGHGSTTIETHDGRKHSFEWGPKSLFALPLNCQYQHFNGSGRDAVRLASTNTLCVMLNLLHNEEFVFDNPFRFPEREGEEGYFTGGGDFYGGKRGRNIWETNFVPDVSAFELKSWEERGAGSTNIKFLLADGILHTHSSEMPVGTYKKAHRHPADYHVFTVHGEGYSLFWYEEDEEYVRLDWRHGWVFAPPDNMFHQHYNTSPSPARYMAVAMGNARYPFLEAKRRFVMGGVDKDVTEGGYQIEYGDQDPRIHGIWLKELAGRGVESRMGDYIDEAAYKEHADGS